MARTSNNAEKYFQKEDEYPNKEALQMYVKEWHIANSRQCKTPRSSKTEIRFKCADESCSWNLRATSGWFGKLTIRKVGPIHTCVNIEPIVHHRNLDASMIQRQIYRHVKDNLSVTIKDLQNKLKDSVYKEYPSYRKMWYAKCLVIERLFGSHVSSFGLLPQHLLDVAYYNPGSVFDFQYKNPVIGETATFDRHIGILRALAEVYPEPNHSHRSCARHLASNFNTHFKNKQLKKKFSGMIYEVNRERFQKEVDMWLVADDQKYKPFINHCGGHPRCQIRHAP